MCVQRRTYLYQHGSVPFALLPYLSLRYASFTGGGGGGGCAGTIATRELAAKMNNFMVDLGLIA